MEDVLRNCCCGDSGEFLAQKLGNDGHSSQFLPVIFVVKNNDSPNTIVSMVAGLILDSSVTPCRKGGDPSGKVSTPRYYYSTDEKAMSRGGTAQMLCKMAATVA